MLHLTRKEDGQVVNAFNVQGKVVALTRCSADPNSRAVRALWERVLDRAAFEALVRQTVTVSFEVVDQTVPMTEVHREDGIFLLAVSVVEEGRVVSLGSDGICAFVERNSTLVHMAGVRFLWPKCVSNAEAQSRLDALEAVSKLTQVKRGFVVLAPYSVPHLADEMTEALLMPDVPVDISEITEEVRARAESILLARLRLSAVKGDIYEKENEEMGLTLFCHTKTYSCVTPWEKWSDVAKVSCGIVFHNQRVVCFPMSKFPRAPSALDLTIDRSVQRVSLQSYLYTRLSVAGLQGGWRLLHKLVQGSKSISEVQDSIRAYDFLLETSRADLERLFFCKWCAAKQITVTAVHRVCYFAAAQRNTRSYPCLGKALSDLASDPDAPPFTMPLKRMCKTELKICFWALQEWAPEEIGFGDAESEMVERLLWPVIKLLSNPRFTFRPL